MIKHKAFFTTGDAKVGTQNTMDMLKFNEKAQTEALINLTLFHFYIFRSPFYLFNCVAASRFNYLIPFLPP